LPGFIGSFALQPNGIGAIVALRQGIFALHFATSTLEPLAASPFDIDRFHFNDGRCDRTGRFLVGTIDRSPIGSTPACALYRLESDHLDPVITPIGVANGLAFSVDNKTMYRAESREKTIYAYDYDDVTGTASNCRIFAQVSGSGNPDGAAVDEEGGYWCALFGGGRILRFNSDGSIDQDISMPILQPTMLAFGGSELKTIFITSAQYQTPVASDLGLHAGGIFAFETNVRGLQEPYFRRR
jgi:L-arabinonolactonase